MCNQILIIIVYINFFSFCVFLYMINYILDIPKAIKRMKSYQRLKQLMKSRSLSLKTIIKELNFIKKAVIIQWDTKKNKTDLLLFTNKLIEKHLILTMQMSTINYFQEKKKKLSKTNRNNYLPTKNLWKSKHCWY